MSAIAIDFGNRNTAIARWNIATNQPELIKLPEVSNPFSSLIPTLLYVQNAETQKYLIGQQVIDHGKLIPNSRLFQQIKRHLSIDTGFNPKLEEIEVTPELAGSFFLKQIISLVRSQQIDISQLIFTVPILAQERYLQWLQSLAKQISIPLRIIDEPTAAALGYAVAEPGSLVLAIDFGAGTIDLALIRLPRNFNPLLSETSLETSLKTSVEVIAKVGAFLGGEEIDRWLVEDYCQKTHRNFEKVEINLLYSLMERIKIQLSTQDRAEEVLFNSATLECEQIIYQRSQLEQILTSRGFYQDLESLLEDLLHRAKTRGILKIDIQQIVMVGGTCLIPSVQDRIAKYFRRDRCHSSDPFGAVVKGALHFSKMQIKDTLVHGYGLRYWQNQPPQWCHQLIFPKGQIYPTKQSREIILSASQPQQSKIELVIGEVYQHHSGLPELIFQGDRLTTIEVSENRIEFMPLNQTYQIPLDPPGIMGSDRLKLSFQINRQRQLCMSVFDLLSQKILIGDRPVTEI
jgi:molecular chaperone DnaK (HSP70)